MDDSDRINWQRGIGDTDDDMDEDVESWPAGLLANHTNGSGTSIASAGSLAAGPIGAAQAGRLVEAEEPKEERSACVHVPVTPEEFGYGPRQTADEDVSARQKESEADELNG